MHLCCWSCSSAHVYRKQPIAEWNTSSINSLPPRKKQLAIAPTNLCRPLQSYIWPHLTATKINTQMPLRPKCLHKLLLLVRNIFTSMTKSRMPQKRSVILLPPQTCYLVSLKTAKSKVQCVQACSRMAGCKNASPGITPSYPNLLRNPSSAERGKT